MYRCEDAPFCGCGPEGCIDRSRVVVCEDCHQRFHPDWSSSRFCRSCIAMDEIMREEEEFCGWEEEDGEA